MKEQVVKLKKYYTAESVTEGHPDKLCDIIADSMLDDCLAHDPASHVACEVLATRGHITVAGETSSRHIPRVPGIVERVLRDVGYQTRGRTLDVLLHRQSPDIAAGVNNPLEERNGQGTGRQIGAGDQGVMVGYVPFPVSWTVKMKKKQKETQDILSYHTQAAGCSDKARAKASGGRQPIEECGRTGL